MSVSLYSESSNSSIALSSQLDLDQQALQEIQNTAESTNQAFRAVMEKLVNTIRTFEGESAQSKEKIANLIRECGETEAAHLLTKQQLNKTIQANQARIEAQKKELQSLKNTLQNLQTQYLNMRSVVSSRGYPV